MPKKEAVEAVQLSRLQQEVRSLKSQKKSLAQYAETLEKKLDVVTSLRDTIDTYIIHPKTGRTKSEAAALMVASDWHVEEIVIPQHVSGLNEYSPEIARVCAERFFTTGRKMIDMFNRDIQIKTLVLALLGDFFTGSIHEENAEGNAMRPMEACLFAQQLIASGIEYLLQRNGLKIVVVCAVGNHSRITAKIYNANEHGHSLEYYMYHNLAAHFRSNPRIRFIIPEGYHSYVDVLGTMIRFHHGHSVRYQGGVGGLYIPMNKAIAQWDKAVKADISVCG